MEQQTGPKLGKKYLKAVYCHPAYLTRQSTPWKTPGWMKHKLESGLQIHRWHQPDGRKRRTKEPLDKSEREEWRSWLKTQHSKNEDHGIWSHQFSSVAQSCPTLCDPMNRSTPGLPVHHQLPEFTQTRVHWVSDSIQPSHPLSSSSLPASNYKYLFPVSGLTLFFLQYLSKSSFSF